MEKKMTKELTQEQKIKYLDNVQKHQIKRISDLQNENSLLDGALGKHNNMLIDIYERIEFLESHVIDLTSHVNALETDQFDLYVDRVVN